MRDQLSMKKRLEYLITHPINVGYLLLPVLLAGCQTVGHVTQEPPAKESELILEQAIAHNQLNTALKPPPAPMALAPLPIAQLAAIEDERFDVSADRLTARTFFMGLVEGTAYNMIVHEDIAGEITLHLKDVTVAEVMKAVRDVYGYEYKRNGNLYQVVPKALETQIFQVNYLDIQRMGKSQTSVSSGSVSQVSNDSSDSSSDSSDSGSDSSTQTVMGTQISTSSQADFWGNLQQTLAAIIGQESGQRVVVTPQTGVIVARAYPSELLTLKSYLEKAELILRRQVVIEAKILEVTLSNGFQAGIDWSAIGTPNSRNSLVVGQSSAAFTNPDNIGGIFSAALNLNDFTALIDLLGRQGNVQVLSSPRVSTLNNQKAVIKVGTDEFYVTDIQNTTTTGTATTSTPDVELTPFFSGIALDVTPQISEDDEIILHIHPSVSEVQDQQKLISIGVDAFNIPLALSSIRESDSVVRASSGQVIVIGGLMKSGSNDVLAKAPGLGDIPGVGKLFQQRQQSSDKSELVILLRPAITDGNSWKHELQRSLDSFRGLQ